MVIQSEASMKVICVIGDLIGSRNSPDRTGLQDRLNQALATINETSRTHLLSPCTITLGDEYQAVYRDAETLFQDAWLVLERVYPEKVRFSLGVGTLTTPVNPDQAIGMDGPGFHVARAAMESPFKRSGSLFRLSHADRPVDPWIGPALDLLSHETHRWKRHRFMVFQRLLTGADPKRIAQEANISATAVYKNIQTGALEAMRDLFGAVTQRINQEVQP